MRTKSLLWVWCLFVSIGMAQTEPRISLGPERLSYPEIAKRMSVGGKRVECARNLQNRLAVVHLKPRPWSEVRQLLEEGLGVRFRLKEIPEGRQQEGTVERQNEGARGSELSKSSNQPPTRDPQSAIRNLEVWVMECPPETLRLESEQQKRFIDYWLDQTNWVESVMFFTRAFSDLPYKEVHEFFKRFEQQRENMTRHMMENAEDFNNAASFTSLIEKFGPDLSQVPPPLMIRLKKMVSELRGWMVSELRGWMQEMVEDEGGSPPAAELEEFMKLKDESLIQMFLLFGSIGIQANASTFLMSRLWEEGLLPEMAREAIRNGISVRTMPLNQAVLRDIPAEDLLIDPLFRSSDFQSGEMTEIKPDHPPYDMLVLSLNLISMAESLHLQARLNACLPDTFKPIQAFFSVDVSLDRRAYAHAMQTDKKAWDEKNKRLQEFLRKKAMQKAFPCDRQQANLVSGVLLAWAKETGSEVIAEYHPMHDSILPAWPWGVGQTIMLDEEDAGALAQMEAEGIEADLPSEDPDELPTVPVSPPGAKPEPSPPPAKQDITIARAFGERTLYDLDETKNVLIVRNRWLFLHHLWDIPSEAVLKLTGGQNRETMRGKPVPDDEAFDYDTLYAFYRAVHPLQGALIDAIYFTSFYRSNSSVSKLRLAVHILNALTPAERRQLLTEGGTVPLSRLPGAVLAQLIPIMRMNVEDFPHAWHPGFINHLPAWELKLTSGRRTRSGTLHVELKAPWKEQPAKRLTDEEEIFYEQRDFYLGNLKAIKPAQKKPN